MCIFEQVSTSSCNPPPVCGSSLGTHRSRKRRLRDASFMGRSVHKLSVTETSVWDTSSLHQMEVFFYYKSHVFVKNVKNQYYIFL